MSDIRIAQPCAYCGELTNLYHLICMKCKQFFYKLGIKNGKELAERYKLALEVIYAVQ